MAVFETIDPGLHREPASPNAVDLMVRTHLIDLHLEVARAIRSRLERCERPSGEALAHWSWFARQFECDAGVPLERGVALKQAILDSLRSGGCEPLGDVVERVRRQSSKVLA